MAVTASDREMVRGLVAQYCDRILAQFARAPAGIESEFAERFALSPSEISEKDITVLEQQLPVPLPPLFVAYLTCGASGGVEWAEYALPSICRGEGLTIVSHYMLDDSATSLWRCGYMQFASGPCGDPVCFDIQRPGSLGDYPVVVFNHDVVPREDWRQRASLQPHARQVAGSFREFLTSLCTGSAPPGDQ